MHLVLLLCFHILAKEGASLFVNIIFTRRNQVLHMKTGVKSIPLTLVDVKYMQEGVIFNCSKAKVRPPKLH